MNQEYKITDTLSHVYKQVSQRLSYASKAVIFVIAFDTFILYILLINYYQLFPTSIFVAKSHFYGFFSVDSMLVSLDYNITLIRLIKNVDFYLLDLKKVTERELNYK